ncbi:hypothetical protein [Spirosoma areae]
MACESEQTEYEAAKADFQNVKGELLSEFFDVLEIGAQLALGTAGLAIFTPLTTVGIGLAAAGVAVLEARLLRQQVQLADAYTDYKLAELLLEQSKTAYNECINS